MSTEVVVRKSKDLSIGRLKLTAVGLEGPNGAPPLEHFATAIDCVGRVVAASNWWIGDLARHAEEWGPEYVELLGRLNIEEKALDNCKWVAKKLSFSTRVESLSWTHHRLVAELAPPEQRRWLRKAAPKEGDTKPRLSVAELRGAVRENQLRAEIEANPLPDGGYRILYADPPWKYSDELIEGYGAAEIVLDAERRLGEMLAEMEKAKGSRGQLRGKSRSGGSIVEPPEKAASLDDLAIERKQSMRWQAEAAVPEEGYQQWVQETRESRRELTSGDLQRMGKEIRREADDLRRYCLNRRVQAEMEAPDE